LSIPPVLSTAESAASSSLFLRSSASIRASIPKGLLSPACNLNLAVFALEGGDGNTISRPLSSSEGAGKSLVEVTFADPISAVSSDLERPSLFSRGVGGSSFLGGGDGSSGVVGCRVVLYGLPAREGVETTLFGPRPRLLVLPRGTGLCLPLALGAVRTWLILGEGEAVVARTR
jgi:hypothetical protein